MINIKVDTTQFDKVFKEYMKYSSRTIVEAINTHAYYIARHATNTTDAVPKDRIKDELMQQARIANVPLAAILVNKERGEKGKKGLNGVKMTAEVEKFIRKRQSYRNFLRSGWIPAIKQLAKLIKQKNAPGVPKVPDSTRVKGKPKGGVNPAKNNILNMHPMAMLWNAIQGSKKSNDAPKVMSILQKGADIAVARETESMRNYIEDKLKKGAKKYWV